MANPGHPPAPGPVVQPNLLAVMEAIGDITFPISKRDLLQHVEGGTVLLNGRNADLREIIAQVHDDFFDDEDELQAALERFYTTPEGEPTEAGALPTGPQESWQSRVGPGDSASARSIIEPPE